MTHPRYRTPEWRTVRKRVLARDRYECQIRLAGCLGRANSVDHKIRPEDGGATYDEANLQACCRPCNTAKRNRELAARAKGTPAPAKPAHGGGWSRNWSLDWAHPIEWDPSDDFETIMAKVIAADPRGHRP